MLIYVDIDETVFKTDSNDYTKIEVYVDAIKKINSLYEEGHTIVYWTARGTVTGKDWRKVTKRQLAEAGAKYHELKFGKPAFDLFIDDKALNSIRWRENGYKI